MVDKEALKKQIDSLSEAELFEIGIIKRDDFMKEMAILYSTITQWSSDVLKKAEESKNVTVMGFASNSLASLKDLIGKRRNNGPV